MVQKLLDVLNEFNRKTSSIQFILTFFGIMLLGFEKTLSIFLLEQLWKIFHTSEIESFSIRYFIAVLIVPFFIVKILFTLIGIFKYYYNKLWA